MKKTLFLILIISLLSCDKKPINNNSGTPTSKSEIAAAQQQSLDKLDPYQIKQGQKVHFVDSQEIINGSNPIRTYNKEWVTEVTQLENSTAERVITTYKTVVDKHWDKDFSYTFKSVYHFPQMTNFELLDQLEDNRYQLNTLVQKLIEQKEVTEKSIQGIAYLNLKQKKVTVVPPQLVKNTKNCKGIKDCRLEADSITFDIVFLLNTGETQTHNIEWLISSDVPYFASILKQCAATVVAVDNLRVLVKQCTEVVDFDN